MAQTYSMRRSWCPRPRQSLGLLALLLVLGACRTVESSHWNLQQLHEPDGGARRVGELRNGIQQLLTEFIGGSEFKVPFINQVAGTKHIADPHGRCLYNLNGLLEARSPSESLRMRQVDMLTWLSAACGYALSRERCALALGELGVHYGVQGPREPDAASSFATPEELASCIARLIHAAVAEGKPMDSGEMGDLDLAQVCAEARGVNLDRNGARRLMLAASALLERSRETMPGRAALEDLRQELAQECIAFALQACLDDENPIVRAAGLGAWIQMTRGRDARPYALALGSGRTEFIQVAIAGMASHGTPPIPPGSSTSDSSAGAFAAEKYWIEVMTDLLDKLREGAVVVALCHGMSQLTGQPENLRPEHWIAWQLDQEALLQAKPSNP